MNSQLTSLIYDREAFEHFVGQDLPWSHSHSVARWGVECRNDPFGHFHALNPSTRPTRYQTGHARSDQPQDWHPNAAAAAEFRDCGATVGCTHPVLQPMAERGSPEAVFPGADKLIRSVEARELVADAALGLVDSVDLGGAGDLDGTEYLYHRLLGCGLRLAASAGTDAMLQDARMWPVSNPPGWFRAYADLRGEPRSVDGWRAALRAGRTFVTNGPWLELEVAGHGLGTSSPWMRPVWSAYTLERSVWAWSESKSSGRTVYLPRVTRRKLPKKPNWIATSRSLSHPHRVRAGGERNDEPHRPSSHAGGRHPNACDLRCGAEHTCDPRLARVGGA
jgi:hypothetical protein